MLSVFLSYAHDDNGGEDIDRVKSEIEKRLKSVYRTPKVSVYYDSQESIEKGELSDTIKNKIDSSQVFIAVVSDNYNRKSGFAYQEFLYFEENYLDDENKIFVPIFLQSPKKIILLSELESRIKTFYQGDLSSIFDISSWVEELSDDLLRQKLNKIAIHIRSNDKTVQSINAQSSPKITYVDLIDGIKNECTKTSKHSVFRNDLISNLLKNLLEEIESLNRANYSHDISLDKSFVIRAKAIFRNAREVFAVSADNASTFWLNPDTRSIAHQYTQSQPEATYRLFVFSSPQSMLRHRWVLKSHYERYGENGRVLITSIGRWEKFLNKIRFEIKEDLPSISEDFGFLTYAFEKNKDIILEARLDRSNLSFSEIIRTEFHGLIKKWFSEVNNVKKRRRHGEEIKAIQSDNEPYFWIYQQTFSGLDSDSWYGCVADVFDGDIDFSPTNNSMIMHTILISVANSDCTKENFEREIKSIMDRVIDLPCDPKQKKPKFIKSIWFGSNEHKLGSVKDPKHQASIHVSSEEVGFEWDYCLTMSFEDEKILKAYYSDSDHADIRKDLYCLLDNNVAMLYALDPLPGDIIESIMKKHIRRMDFRVPNPFAIYSSIGAPEFE